MRGNGILVGLVVCTCASTAVIADPGFIVVARTGQAAPAGALVSYEALHTPFINPSGQIAFGATLVGPMANAANNSAIFAGSPGSPALLVRSGTALPSQGPDFTLGPIDTSTFGFNREGHAVFGAPVNGPGIDPSTSFAYWLATPASLLKVGPTAAGGALSRPLLTAGDLVAYQSNDGVHVWSPTNPNPPPAGSSIERALINPGGAVAFLGSNDSGLAVYLGPPGNVQAVVTAGDPAPGTPAGTTFVAPFYPSVNAAGQVAFPAVIELNGQSTDSLWAGARGAIALVARAGEVAPGTGGLRYGGFNIDIDTYRTRAISPTGEAAFTVGLDNDQGHQAFGLFAGKPGQVRLVAMEGQQAANAPVDVTVGEVNFNSIYTINARGQVVFADSSGDLYAADPDAGLRLIAAVGQPFQLAPGDIRTIATVLFGEGGTGTGTGGEDGRPVGFNDAGQLAFGLTFTDNTSAVVFTTVPEPATSGVLAVAACVAIGRRRLGRSRLHG
jgi:hypothetical protein